MILKKYSLFAIIALLTVFASNISFCDDNSNYMVYADGFEYNGVLSPFDPMNAGLEHCLNVVMSPARSGNYALRFEVKDSDPLVHNGKRSEVSTAETATIGNTYYYGFSIYLPDDYPITSVNAIVAQWLQPDQIGPSLQIFTKDDKWNVMTTSDAGSWSSQICSFNRGEWTDFIVEVTWQTAQNAVTKIYVNDNLQINKTASNYGNCHTYATGPYLKFGLYTGNLGAYPYTRALYYDQVRCASAAAGGTSADVTPSRKYDGNPWEGWVRIEASDDAYVVGGVNSDTNYDDNALIMRKNGNESYYYQSHIKFDISKLRLPITEAKMTLYSCGAYPAVAVALCKTSSYVWSEATLTWNNAPSMTYWAANIYLHTEDIHESSSLASYLQSVINGKHSEVGFYLSPGTDDYYQIQSREYIIVNRRPALLVK